jgi:hypothetical protein
MYRNLVFGLAAGLLATLVGCSGSSDDPAPAQLRVVHGSADAPAVDILLNSRSIASSVPFKGTTGFLSVNPGKADLKVNVAGTSTTALAAMPELESGRFYTVMAVDQVAALKSLVIPEDGVAPGTGQVKVRVVHAVPKVSEVDVYVTTPSATLDGTSPTLSAVPFLGFSNALEVPASTYRIRITGAGSKTAVYDSGSVSLAAGSNLVLAAVEETLGASPVTLLGLTRDPANPTLEIPDALALLRASHASPDAPGVDVLVNGSKALGDVVFPITSEYLPILSGTINLKVNVAGTDTTVINADLPLVARKSYSVFAVDLVSHLAPLVVEDDLRVPALGKAKLRAVHLSPDAPDVDVWVNGVKELSNVAFKAYSPYLEVPAGVTDVKIHVAGTATVVLSANPTLSDGGIYTAAAIGTLTAVPSTPLALNLLRDK